MPAMPPSASLSSFSRAASAPCRGLCNHDGDDGDGEGGDGDEEEEEEERGSCSDMSAISTAGSSVFRWG